MAEHWVVTRDAKKAGWKEGRWVVEMVARRVESKACHWVEMKVFRWAVRLVHLKAGKMVARLVVHWEVKTVAPTAVLLEYLWVDLMAEWWDFLTAERSVEMKAVSRVELWAVVTVGQTADLKGSEKAVL